MKIGKLTFALIAVIDGMYVSKLEETLTLNYLDVKHLNPIFSQREKIDVHNN